MTKKKVTIKNTSKVDNSGTSPLQNSALSSLVLGFDPTSGQGTQLSQLDTLFKESRWHLLSNMRNLLSQIYVEHGLIQTLVDIPVDDGLRGGVEVITKELDEDDIDMLQTKMEREGDIAQVGQAIKWARLFGGGGIIPITHQRPETPLDVSKIKQGSEIEFKAVDLWELFHDALYLDDDSLESLEQKFSFKKSHYNFYGKKLHSSRVLRVKGLEAPSMIRRQLRGWGYSVVESTVRSINQYLKANGLSFEVLDEFKIDIFKIKGLKDALINPDAEERIRRRIHIATAEKNYKSALTLDGEDDYLQKQLSFTGVAEVMDGIRKQIASDLRIPMTKLFGQSSAGFNSGEDDIENYNSMVESTIRSKCKFEIIKIVEIRCQQLFGFIPEDIKIRFKPLRVLSSTDEEGVKTQIFNRLIQARQAGEISPRDFKEMCNRADLLPLKLDVTDEVYASAIKDEGLTFNKEGE